MQADTYKSSYIYNTTIRIPVHLYRSFIDFSMYNSHWAPYISIIFHVMKTLYSHSFSPIFLRIFYVNMVSIVYYNYYWYSCSRWLTEVHALAYHKEPHTTFYVVLMQILLLTILGNWKYSRYEPNTIKFYVDQLTLTFYANL